jgi:hypothetical protein
VQKWRSRVAFSIQLIRELSPQPGSRDRPFALHRCGRDSDDFRSFIKRKSAEVAQLDDPFLLGVQGSETLKSVVKGQNIDIARAIGRIVANQRHTLPAGATFAGVSFPCPIDKNPPHDLGSDTVKMRPILPLDAPLIDQADISFMNECSRLKRIIGPLSPQTPGSEAPKLPINQRQQILECPTTTLIPLDQKLGDFRCVVVHVYALSTARMC